MLFKGNYDPQIVAGSGSSAGFQNFTVSIPSATPKGPALLNIGHYFLGGVCDHRREIKLSLNPFPRLHWFRVPRA